MRSTPGRVAFTVCALALGAALAAAELESGSNEALSSFVGITIVTVTALSAARVPDPVRLRTSAMLGLAGAQRSMWRRIVVVDLGVSAVIAVGPGLLLGSAVSGLSGNGGPDWWAAAIVLLIPVLVAIIVGGFQKASVMRPMHNTRRARLTSGIRLIGAAALVGLGIVIPGFSRSWFDLELTLIPGLVMVAIGLSLVAPMLLARVALFMSRVVPRPSAHLAGKLTVDRRRALGPAVCLVAAGTLAVVVQTVLGAGLVAREADRRSSFDLRAGTSADQVIVEAGNVSGLDRLDWVMAGNDTKSVGLTSLDMEALEQAAPDSIVAQVIYPFTTLGSSGQGGLSVPVVVKSNSDRGGEALVAVSSPELLRALGLERFEAEVTAGRALVVDPDVEVVDGSVVLEEYYTDLDPNSATPGPIRIPARAVGHSRTPTRLPAVIVDRETLEKRIATNSDTVMTGAVLRLPHPASHEEVQSIAEAAPDSSAFRTVRGDALDLELLDDDRLDASESVVIRDSADVIGGVLLVGLAGLAALVVGLRFAALAHRTEDDLFEMIGAPSATLRRIAAWQGALVTLVGVALGLAVGLIGIASGLARYNSFGRGDLPPIPFSLPTSLLVGLLVLPLAGAALAWISAGRRPPVDLVLMSERLAW